MLWRKFRLEWAAISEALSDLRTALHPIRPITVDTHLAAIELAKTHGFSFYDALVVASALEARCGRLLTEDLQAGRRINGLTIVNPFA
ncbi:MAG: PIN domain-containing protein [Rhodospirillales bacterium]|nr:PIN domain-containing protein [Rhodospirillales bacterium]